MSNMLANIAKLKARRAMRQEVAPTKHVDAALAAAAARVGKPTGGTWDADYARRLRTRAADEGGGASDSESEGELVVLPPRMVKLDPVAQRERWGKEMRRVAREMGQGVGEEEEGEEEEGEEMGSEEPVSFDEEALLREVKDEEDNMEGAGEGERVGVDEKVGGDESHCTEEGVERAEEDGCDSGEIVPIAGEEDALGSDALHAKGDAPESAGNDESILPQPLLEESPLTPEASFHSSLRVDAAKPRVAASAYFVDDQAEEDGDEEHSGGACDDNGDEQDFDSANNVEGIVGDDVEVECSSTAAAALHRKWQEANENDKVAALMAGASSKRAVVPRSDDNAMDLSEMVACGAVVASSGIPADGGGDHGVSDKEEVGEIFDMQKSRPEDYVEEMFRMRDEETMFANEDDTPDKDAAGLSVEERRERAEALWKARKRHESSATVSADLSRCAFFEDETNNRTELYRAQIQRACGASVSRDAAVLPEAESGPARASKRRLPVPFPQGRTGATAIPEVERRRICMERKRTRRLAGTSIGKWAFDAAGNDAGLSNSANNANKPSSRPTVVGVSGVHVARKRNRTGPKEGDEAAGPSVSAPQMVSIKRKKQNAKPRGILQILGQMPSRL